MDIDEKRRLLAEINSEIKLADGFEDALIGVVRQFNKAVALYDREHCIQILVERDGMTIEEAEEHLEFNVLGAWVGEGTPAFATFFDDIEFGRIEEGEDLPEIG